MPKASIRKRRQPDRKAKKKAAREQMGQRKLKNGMHDAAPNSYYLAKAQRNANKSALLRLPPEIRRRIWSLVLQVSRNFSDTVEIATRYYPIGPVTHPRMTVLRTCRQIHAETCLLPYAVTTFCFYEPEAFEEWVKNRLPEQKAAVERIAIFCSDCTTIPLRWLPSLKSVDVYCICDGNCPDWLERGEAILDALEASWGNDDLEVRFLSGSGNGSN